MSENDNRADFSRFRVETPSRVEFQFPGQHEAAAFYGMKIRNFLKLKHLGDECGDPLPFQCPAAMVEWFDRMRASGRRKHRTPPEIIARADQAAGRSPSLPLPDSPADTASQPDLPVSVADEEATNDAIIAQLRTMSATFGQLMNTALAAGRMQEFTTHKAQFDRTNEQIRQWSVSAKRIREGADYLHRDEVAAHAANYHAALWRLLFRELTAAFSPSETTRVTAILSDLASRMPFILPAEAEKTGELHAA